MKYKYILLALLLMIFLGQTAWFYPLLPATIASHFGADGHANGFMDKTSFFTIEWGIAITLSGIFQLLGRLLSRLPDSWINMPNKDYWLAPERRVQTLASFSIFFSWLNACIIALFIVVNQIVLSADLARKDPDPTRLWIAIVIFIATAVVLMVVNITRFFRPRMG